MKPPARNVQRCSPVAEKYWESYRKSSRECACVVTSEFSIKRRILDIGDSAVLYYISSAICAEGLHFSAFILFSNSVCIFTENPSISSSMSSGIDSSIISSRLANSVLLVYWLIACGPVFVQFRQLHPSPQAFPFALHPHWRVWHPVLHPHPLRSPATRSCTSSMLLGLSHSTESYHHPAVISKRFWSDCVAFSLLP